MTPLDCLIVGAGRAGLTAALYLARFYPALGCRMRSELAVALGARTTEAGDIFVDAHQQTAVHNALRA